MNKGNKIRLIIILIMAICISPIVVSDFIDTFIQETSRGYSITHFSEPQLERTQEDPFYPCYVGDKIDLYTQKINCPAIVLDKKDDWIKDIDNKEISKELKKEFKDLLDLDKTLLKEKTKDGENIEYIDISQDTEIIVDLKDKSKKIEIGFGTNVFSITDFFYGTAYNVSIDTNVTLTNIHTTQNQSHMVGYWKFTDDATDSSLAGYGNDGAVTGAVHVHEKYEFDGIGNNDEILITKGSEFNFSADDKFTVSAWVKPYDTATHKTIVTELWQVSSGWLLWIVNDKFQLDINDGGAERSADADSTLTYGEWYHVVGVVNGSTVLLYVDGVLQADQPALVSGTNTALGDIEIGEDRNLRNWNGTIDEVIIWNITLSQTDISNLYNDGLYHTVDKGDAYIDGGILDMEQYNRIRDIAWTCVNDTYSNCSLSYRSGNYSKVDTSDTGLFDYWNLSDAESSTDFLSWTNTNNGSCSANGCPNRTAGLFENDAGMSFDGVDDYITITHDSSLNFSRQNFTITAWFNAQDTGNSNKYIVNKFGGSANEFSMQLGSSTDFICRVWNSTGNAEDNGFDDLIPGYGQWVHGACIFNGTSILTYINGVFKDSSAVLGYPLASGTDVVKIGSTSHSFNGSIDSVAIYNRSLSEEEVWDLYTEWGGWSTATTQSPVTINTDNRTLQYRVYLESDNTTSNPYLTNVTLFYNDSIPNLYSFNFYALNSSEILMGVDETSFNTTNLEDIEKMRINFTITDDNALANDITLFFTANGTNGCSLGNNQSSTCYKYPAYIEFKNGTKTSTFEDRGHIGDYIECNYTGNTTQRDYSCTIDEHYNPNVCKPYPLDFTNISWQDGTSERIKKKTIWKILVDTNIIPLDADWYKLDFRANYTTNEPTQQLLTWACNSTYTTGNPETSDYCQLVGGKLPGEFQDDGTKVREIFTKNLTQDLGDIQYILLESDSVGNKYYYMKTFESESSSASRTSISNDGGSSYTNLSDGYETELNVNWFYDSTNSNNTQIIFKVQMNDDAGQLTNSSKQIMTWDLTSSLNEPPIVDIIVPEIGTNHSRTIDINWTTAEPNADMYKTNITIFNGTYTPIVSNLPDATSTYRWNTTGFTDGKYNLTIESCENATTELYCGNDTHKILIDNTGSNITLIHPINGYYEPNRNVNFEFMVGPSTSDTANCSIWFDGVRQTTVSPITENIEITKVISDIQGSSIKWNISCEDYVGNSNWSETRTLILLHSQSAPGGGDLGGGHIIPDCPEGQHMEGGYCVEDYAGPEDLDKVIDVVETGIGKIEKDISDILSKEKITKGLLLILATLCVLVSFDFRKKKIKINSALISCMIFVVLTYRYVENYLRENVPQIYEYGSKVFVETPLLGIILIALLLGYTIYNLKKHKKVTIGNYLLLVVGFLLILFTKPDYINKIGSKVLSSYPLIGFILVFVAMISLIYSFIKVKRPRRFDIILILSLFCISMYNKIQLFLFERIAIFREYLYTYKNMVTIGIIILLVYIVNRIIKYIQKKEKE